MGRLARALLALVMAGTAVAARAQDGLVVSPGVPQGFDRGRNVSVAQQPRPSYTPTGARIGGLMIYPQLRMAAGGTTNTYLTPQDAITAPFVSLAPAVQVASLWSRHALRLDARALERRYLAQPRRDERTWALAGEGDLELGSALRVTTRIVASQQLEGPLSGEVAPALVSVSRFRRDLLSLRVHYVGGRVRAFAIADTAAFRFAPIRRAGGTRFDQSFRDREVTRITGQVEYARSPSVSLFVQAGHISTRFDTTGRAAIGSDMVRAAAGLNFDLAGRARGTASVGYADRRYRNGTHERGLVAEAQGEAFPTQRLTLVVRARRSLEDATYGNRAPQPFWDERLSLGADYELLANLILSATADLARQREIASGRRGTADRLAASARYLVSRRVTLDGAISHVARRYDRDDPATAAREMRAEAGLTYHL